MNSHYINAATVVVVSSRRKELVRAGTLVYRYIDVNSEGMSSKRASHTMPGTPV